MEKLDPWLTSSNSAMHSERVLYRSTCFFPFFLFKQRIEWLRGRFTRLVYGYPRHGGGENAFDSMLNFKLLDLIVKHSSGKPVLVFCNTRKGCMTAAEKISAGELESLVRSWSTFTEENDH
jgi:hypothetical protein